jgi:hypothetical protein
LQITEYATTRFADKPLRSLVDKRIPTNNRGSRRLKIMRIRDMTIGQLLELKAFTCQRIDRKRQ